MDKSRHFLLTVALANLIFLALFVLSEPPRRVEARHAPSGPLPPLATSAARQAQPAAAPSPLPVKPRPAAIPLPESNTLSSQSSAFSPNPVENADVIAKPGSPTDSPVIVARVAPAPGDGLKESAAEASRNMAAPSKPVLGAVPLDSPLLSPGVDLGVSMVWQSGRRVPGQTLTYRISYRNNGSQDATSVIVTDTLPAGTSYWGWSSSVSFWTLATSGNTVTWTTSNLYRGESGYIDVTVSISSTVAEGTVLTNTVEIGSSESDSNPGDNQTSLPLTVLTVDRDLAISKYLSQGSAVPGQEITYQLDYQNYGTSPAGNVLITDTLPSGAAFVSTSNSVSATVSGNQVTWNLGTIAGRYNSGYHGSIYLTVRLADTLEVGSSLCNQAEISTSDPETGASVNRVSYCSTVQALTRDVRVYVYFASGYPVIGADVTYRIDYYKSGNASAHNVVVTDTLPAGVSYVSASGAFTPTRTGNLLVWNLGTVPSPYTSGNYGELYVTAHISESVRPGTSLCNQVDISTSDAETGSDQNTDTDCRVAEAPTRDLGLSKALYTGTPGAGNLLTYELHYYASGYSPAANVIMTDTLPPGMAYDPAYASWDYWGWTRTISGNQVIWTKPSMSPGSSGSVYVSGRISTTWPAGTNVTNTAEISTSSAETNYENNVARLGERVLPAGVDLGVSQTWQSGSAASGQGLAYRIDFQNNGAQDSGNITIVDTLPAGMSYSWYYYSSGSWYMSVNGNVVTWTSLYPVRSGYIDLHVNISSGVADGTVLTNTVEISSGDADINPDDNRATLALTVYAGDRDLALSQRFEGGNAAPGQEIRYELYYRNEGTSSAANVLMTQTLPAGISFVSATGGPSPTISGDKVVWNLGTVPGEYDSGYYGYIHVTLRLADSIPVGSSFCTLAEISTSDHETGHYANAVSTCSTVQAPWRNLRVSQSVENYPIFAGTDIVYRISYQLDGNAPATNVVITDTLPPSLTNIFFDTDYYGFTTIITGSTVVWTKPSIASGTWGTLSLRAYIPDTLAPGTLLTNTVRISSSELDTDETNNVSTDTRTVAAHTQDLRVSSQLVMGTAVAGNDIGYSIHVQNIGNTEATNVFVTNTLPLSTTFVADTNADGFTAVVTGSTVVWTRPIFGAGGYAYLNVTARIADSVRAGDRLTNTTQVSNAEGDVDPTNNVFTHSVTAQSPTTDISASTYSYSLFNPGNQVTYYVNYSNSANSAAEDVILTDTLPVSTTFVSSSGTVTPTVVGNRVVWNLGRVPCSACPGGSGGFWVTLRLSDQIVPGTTLTNTVDVETTSWETNYRNNHAYSTNTVFSGTADPSLSMTFDGWYAAPGSDVTYRLDISNYSSSAALNAVITDTLPAGTTYARSSGAGTPTINGSNLVWNLGAIPGDSRQTIYLTATVASNVLPGAVLTNTAVISASNDTNAANNRATDVHTVVAATWDAYVSKSLTSANPVVGTEVVYRVHYGNNGAADMRNTIITDTLPAGLEFVSGTGPSAPMASGNLLIWNLGTVSAYHSGDLDVTVHISSSIRAGISLCNRVDISTSDTETGTSPNTSTTCMTPQAPTRDLSIAKTGSSSGVPGGTLYYNLHYASTGNSPAANVSIIDTLPAGVTYIPNAYEDSGWTRTASGNQIVWTRASLPAGASSDISFYGRVSRTAPAGTVLTNTVQIATSDVETDYSNNTSAAAAHVLSSRVDLGVSQTWIAGKAVPGESFTFRISYQNNGALSPNNVVLTDQLPQGMSVAGLNYSACCWSMVQAGNVITWTRSGVYPGEPGYIDLAVNIADTVADGTVLTNTVEIGGSTGDENPGDNRSTLPLTISTAYRDLSIEKSEYQSAPVAGQDLIYQLSYHNDGTATAAGVLVTDTLPAGVTFVSASGGLARTMIGNRIIWSVGSVPGQSSAGHDGELYVTVHLPDNTPIGGMLCNQADISTSETETGVNPNGFTLCSTVQAPTRDLSVSKSLDAGDPIAGGDVRYRIDFANTGNASAENVIITDTLPLSTTFVSYTAFREPGHTTLFPTVNVSEGRVVWGLGTLASQARGAIYLSVHISETATAGQSLVNVAGISTSQSETDYADNTATKTLIVRTQVPRDLSISKSLNTGTRFPGTDVQYQIYFANSGDIRAENVVITDTLPLSTTYVSCTGYMYNPSYTPLTMTASSVGNSIVWNLGTLEGHATGYLYPTIHISEAAPGNQALDNTVSISSSQTEANYENNASTVRATVQPPTPDVAVEVRLISGIAVAGSDVSYGISIWNRGNTDATDIMVTSTLPLETDYVSDSNSYGFTTAVTGSMIIWTKPSLPVGFYGGIVLRAHIRDTVSSGTQLTNTTRISARGQDVNPGDNVYTHVMTTQVPTRDVAISSESWSSSPPPGSDVSYYIRYSNYGNSPAENVIITDTLPVSTTYVSSSGAGTPVIIGNQVIWSLGRRSPSSTYLFLIVHVSDQAPAGTVLTNSLDISTSSPETNYANNHASTTLTVHEGDCDLSLSKSLRGDSLPRGALATYEISYQNTHGSYSANTVLTDTLPAGMSYVSSNAPVTPTVNGSTVVWNLPGVEPYTSERIIKVIVSVGSSVSPGTVLTNTASISGSNDTYLENNRARDAHTVSEAARDLYVTMEAGTTGTAREILYTLRYGNNGNTSAVSTILTDTLPAGTSFISAMRPPQYPYYPYETPYYPTHINGNQLVWDIGTLDNTWNGGSDGYLTLLVRARVADTLSTETLLTNTVEIGTVEPETSYDNNRATNVRAVYQTGVDLLVTKAAVESAAPGDMVEFWINYRNRGGVNTAYGSTITVEDVLPAGMVFYSEWHDSNWSVTTAPNRIVWTRAGYYSILGPGESGWLRLMARIDGGMSPGTVLTNTVSIGGVADITPANNSFQYPFVVADPARDVFIGKRLDSGVLVAGEDLTYVLTYGNSGNRPAAGIVLTDTIPTGTTFITSMTFSGTPMPPSTITGNRLAWSIGTVESGWYYDLKVQVHISDTLAVGTRLTNTATIATSDAEMTYANNTAVLTGATTLGNPVPVITSVRPVSVSAGSPAFTLSVTGTGFIAGSQVWWNGAPRSTTFVSSTLITAVIPASDIVSPMTATIEVFNPRPGGGESNAISLPVEKTGTTVALTSSANPSVIGQPVSFTATVTALAPSTLMPTGTVQFQIDGTNWMTVTLANGIATTPPTSTLALSPHSVTALYSGDANSQPSTGSLLGGQTVERAYTSVAITSSGWPTEVGQPVTFTATVTILPPGTAALTGTVQFKDNGSAFSPPLLLSGNVASYTTSSFNAGTHPITAEYGGDTNLRPSTSVTLTQQVLPASTLVNLATGTPNPSVFGQPVLLTATLTSGAGIPTGAVAFKEMATTLGTGTLDTNGIATTTVSSLIVGTHTITATYAGMGNFGAATSNTITQTVQKAETSITIIGSTRNPSVVGESVAVTYTLAVAPPGAGTPTGTVTIGDGATSCTATLPALGCSLVFTTTGAHNLTARYGGDASFNTSTSPAAIQTVNKANVSVALTSSANPIPFADPLIFTATVSAAPPGAGAPSGTVSFKDGTVTLGTGTLSGGKATFTTATLAMGSHSMTAVYEGDSAFDGGASSALDQMIGKARSSTAVASSANPAVFGQGISFTATVTSAVAGAGTPTGNVQFRVDSADWGAPAALVNGRATSPVSSTLSVGNHTVTAAYRGDDGFDASNATLAGGQVITKANTATTVISSKPTSALGESVVLTATVAALAPGAGTPTGSVQFRDDDVVFGSATLSAGTATFPTAVLSGGSHVITAVYGDDGNFVGSTSTGISQTVSRANPSITLRAAPTPSVFGQPVILTTTVTSAFGIPTGTVALKEGVTTLMTSTLNASGVAVATLSSLAAGTHTITATYEGDTSFNSITSASISQAVGKANTTASLTSAPVTPVFGQAVIFTATVTTLAPGAGTPTGSVTFKDEMNTLGTGTLNAGGVATLITNTLTVGGSPHTISAVYGGDFNLNASPAVTISQTVTRANAAVLVTSSLNPSLAMQPVAFTATVSAVAPGAGTPGGTVIFKIDATDWITMTLVNGKVATPMTSTLSVGNHAVTVVYSGDDNFNPGTGALLGSQTVNEQSTTTTVQSSPNPSVWGQPVTLTATVISDVGTPSGMVSLKVGTKLLGIGELSYGVTTLVTSTLAVGTHAITAEYGGNGVFDSSSGALTGGQRVKGTTSTTIKAHSPSPSNEGAPVTVAFSLTVTSPGGGAPSGTVTVSGGGTITCTAGIAEGSCALVFANPGSKSLTATYPGDSSFAGSTSPSVSHTVNNLVPTIASISPPSSRAGSAGFTLTVTGTNFIEGSVVRWNGSPRTTVFVSSTQLKATILITDLRTPGTASITIAHPAPAGDVSNAVTHTIVASGSKSYLPLIVR